MSTRWGTDTEAVGATGQRYPNWDALVAAEAHGYVVVVTSDKPGTAPAVWGVWTDKVEATKARVRIRNRAAKEVHPYKVKSYLRILWKEVR